MDLNEEYAFFVDDNKFVPKAKEFKDAAVQTDDPDAKPLLASLLLLKSRVILHQKHLEPDELLLYSNFLVIVFQH